MEDLIKDLTSLITKESKHSHYQSLNENLLPFIDKSKLNIKSRHEKERLEYILDHIKPEGLSILEIGGNTGFFSFELLGKGARSIDFYEGNKIHAEFVKEASKLLKLEDKITVFDEYFQFDQNFSNTKYDANIKNLLQIQ